jgi:hypothetical protein
MGLNPSIEANSCSATQEVRSYNTALFITVVATARHESNSHPILYL